MPTLGFFAAGGNPNLHVILTNAHPSLRRDHPRRRRRRTDVRHRSRQARPPRRGAGACRTPGKKILISGGGRCNFTNFTASRKISSRANPHFAKSALARYTPADFIALVEKHRIPYHEKTLGQLFCDRSARDILDMLEEECRAAGVQIFLNTQVQEVTRTTEFVVRSRTNEFRAPALVVATGGLSIPKMGATSFGYDLARQFGLKIEEPRPALVPFVLSAEDRKRYCDLAGVSAEVVTSTGQAAVPREDADHASRPERPGDPADLVLLETGHSDSDRSRSRPAKSRLRIREHKRAT